jgi:hypothetical protein
MKHEKAREVGLKLFYDNTTSEQLRNYAFDIRFGKNYSLENDKADFAALLRSPIKIEQFWMIGILIKNIKNNVPGIPTEYIQYAFERSEISQRYYLCKTLIEKNMFPEELKNECLNDANVKIRNLFLV